MEKHDIDQEYFDTYGGENKSYSKYWKNYTVGRKQIVSYFKKLNLKATSFIDMGAADGSFLTEMSKYIPSRGVELFKNIVPENMKLFIDIGDVRHHSFSYSDIIFLNGFAYFTPKELNKLFNSLPCKYIVCCGPTYDSIRYNYLKGELPSKMYEATIRPYSWWINYFHKIGFKILIHDYFYILEKSKEEFIPPIKINDYFKIKYSNDFIMFNKVKLLYEGRKIIIENASEEDLIQLSYIVCSFRNNGIIAIGDYNCFIPGWYNTIKGNVRYNQSASY